MNEDQQTEIQQVVLRDYKYLDTDRLSDYLSAIDPGIFDEVRQKTRAEAGTDSSLKVSAIGFGSIDWAGGGYKEDENTLERTVKIEAKHSFNRLYQRLLRPKSIDIFNENDYITSEKLKNLQARNTVEITRYFVPMPNQFIDSIFEVLMKTNVTEVQETKAIFEQHEIEKRIPLISPPSIEDDASVIFLANPKFVIGSQRSLEGRLAVCGKVQEKILAGPPVDMLKLLTGLSRDDLHDLLYKPEARLEQKPSEEELDTYKSNAPWYERWFGQDERETIAKEKRVKEERTRVKAAVDNIFETTTKVHSPAVIITRLAAYS